MTDARINQPAGLERPDPNWRPLYRIGGIAPLITLALYLTELLVIVIGGQYPATMEDWFQLFQRSKVLALLYLNAPDTLSIAILGLMFLAIYFALRRASPSWMTVATFLAFLGVAVFVTTRAMMVSAMLSLSDRYAVAATEAQRAQLLIAGDAITSPARATPETTGFLFLAVASLIISGVSLRSRIFSRAVSYVGILGGTVTVANDVSMIIAPAIAGVLMPLNMLLWPVWWILVSRGLFRLARGASEPTSSR